MPNWCENTLMITGDPIRLQQFVEKHIVKYEFDFNTIIPEPKTQDECPSVYILNTEHIQIDKDKPWFNWYTWHCDYWGTKWNACDTYYEIYDDTLEIIFNTAWSAVPNIIRKLSKLYPDLHLSYMYYESGCQYGGSIETSSDGLIEVQYEGKALQQFAIDNDFASPDDFKCEEE